MIQHSEDFAHTDRLARAISPALDGKKTSDRQVGMQLTLFGRR